MGLVAPSVQSCWKTWEQRMDRECSGPLAGWLSEWGVSWLARRLWRERRDRRKVPGGEECRMSIHRLEQSRGTNGPGDQMSCKRSDTCSISEQEERGCGETR